VPSIEKGSLKGKAVEMPRGIPKRKLDPNPIYYCYILFDWLGVPRWVGKGMSNRINQIIYHSDPVNWMKNEFVERTWIMLEDLPRIKVREHITEQEAFETEVALIAVIGRFPYGPLYNMTDGGDGAASCLRARYGSIIECKVCGRKFYCPPSIAKKRKYCSQRCHGIAETGSTRTKRGVVKKCVICDKEFYVKPPKTSQVCCSIECRTQYLTGRPRSKHVTKICKNCGKEFTRPPCKTNRPYCCTQCYFEYRRKHPKLPEIRYCACGCGTPLRGKNSKGWVRGHWLRDGNNAQEVLIKRELKHTAAMAELKKNSASRKKLKVYRTPLLDRPNPVKT
jgi:hypothetical protein